MLMPEMLALPPAHPDMGMHAGLTIVHGCERCVCERMMSCEGHLVARVLSLVPTVSPLFPLPLGPPPRASVRALPFRPQPVIPILL